MAKHQLNVELANENQLLTKIRKLFLEVPAKALKNKKYLA